MRSVKYQSWDRNSPRGRLEAGCGLPSPLYRALCASVRTGGGAIEKLLGTSQIGCVTAGLKHGAWLSLHPDSLLLTSAELTRMQYLGLVLNSSSLASLAEAGH